MCYFCKQVQHLETYAAMHIFRVETFWKYEFTFHQILAKITGVAYFSGWFGMGYVNEQKTTHSVKALFLFFIDNNSECDTHLILVSIYWSIAHSASETCWVPCLKEMKNFTMSEITRELREVKVVAHDHWKDTTDKKQDRQHFDTGDLNRT